MKNLIKSIAVCFVVLFSTGASAHLDKDTSMMESKEYLLDWAEKSVVETNTYSFSSWRTDFSKAQKHFTQKGWQDYFAILKSSGNLVNLMIDQKYNVSSIMTSVPIVVSKRYENGVWTWVVEFQLLKTFESANGKVSSNHAYHVTVVRVPEDVNPNGLAISEISRIL